MAKATVDQNSAAEKREVVEIGRFPYAVDEPLDRLDGVGRKLYFLESIAPYIGKVDPEAQVGGLAEILKDIRHELDEVGWELFTGRRLNGFVATEAE